MDYGAVLKIDDQNDFHDLMAVLESRIWRNPFFEEQDTQRHKKSRNSHKRQLRLQFIVFIENTSWFGELNKYIIYNEFVNMYLVHV